MPNRAVVYLGVNKEVDEYFWCIPIEEPSDSRNTPQPIVHGPFRSRAAAEKDAEYYLNFRLFKTVKPNQTKNGNNQ